MRAIVIARPGGPEVLTMQELPDPQPGPGQIAVRVAAAGVNRADLAQRAGRYAAPAGWPADILGLEYAGVVEAVGEGVLRWSPGDRVMGLVGGGAYAERVVVNEATAIPVPANLSLEEAAAVPETFITAHDALHTMLGVHPGETLLIHGVGSGVGTSAVQIGKAAGTRVIGTSRTPWKLERAAELGMDVGIDSSRDDVVEAIMSATDGAGVAAILDLVGGAGFEVSLQVLTYGGRIALLGLVAGSRVELDLRLILSRRATIRGATIRHRPLDEHIALADGFTRDIVPLFERGTLRPVIDRIVPMEQVAAAHERIAANETFGKIVLRWS